MTCLEQHFSEIILRTVIACVAVHPTYMCRLYITCDMCVCTSILRLKIVAVIPYHACNTSVPRAFFQAGIRNTVPFFLGNDEGPGFKRNELQPMFYVTHQCCIYQSRSFPSLEVLQQPTSSMEPSGNSASTYSLPCETLCFLSTWGFLVSNQAPKGETSRMEGMARCPCPLVQAALG